MDFTQMRAMLAAQGYSPLTADAKIAHDVVLEAIRDAGFHDNLTVKGGVVMSGISNMARRATLDMDVDLLHYSLGEVSLRRFVSRLNRHSACEIAIDGAITELRQQDYRGKRIYLIVKDEDGQIVRTKVDVGVHTYEAVVQGDRDFQVVTSEQAIRLLANPPEQIFAEKLKSLLRLGPVSTRFKDVYDLYYLSSRVRKTVLRKYLAIFIYQDARMMENNLQGVLARLNGVFSSKTFMRRLAAPNVAWLDVPAATVVQTILDFLKTLEPAQKRAGTKRRT